MAAVARIEQMFPTLSAPQAARVARHGRMRKTGRGEILFEAGTTDGAFFVVASGRVDILRRSVDDEESLIQSLGPGQFTGEVNLLSGRRPLVRARVAEAGEVVELDRESLLALVQTDSELSEILMRAFILRRVELINRRLGDVVLIGSAYCASTLSVRQFLTRNNHPYDYIDLEEDADVQALLDRLRLTEHDIPVLVCRGEIVLRRPTPQQIADCLGLNDAIDSTKVRDVVVIGAGPAGLAAAVFGASEGLDVLVVESREPGGQAATSSKIENFFGFPTGITGQALTSRGYAQAQKFGAQVMVAQGATQLGCTRRPYSLSLGNGQTVHARTIVIASGADYRKPAVENLARYEGTGVYYAATSMEAKLVRGEPVVVIGGGNSAGQAAVFLAQSAERVHILVRRDGLAATLSRYLSRRIEESPAIELHPGTELAELEGEDRLERLAWADRRTGALTRKDIRHVFIMAGAAPATRWLEGCIALDGKGFIRTGPELTDADLQAAGWPLARRPQLFETTLPGVFAVGDVRSGNVKRVASAVGEGSVSISFVHHALIE